MEFFQKGPNQAPKKVGCTRTTSEVRGRRNAAFVLVFPELLVFSRVSRTSVDIAGGLWSWDGWPPNSPSKYLFSQLFCFSGTCICPQLCPLKRLAATGRRWTLPPVILLPRQLPARSLSCFLLPNAPLSPATTWSFFRLAHRLPHIVFRQITLQVFRRALPTVPAGPC